MRRFRWLTACVLTIALTVPAAAAGWQSSGRLDGVRLGVYAGARIQISLNGRKRAVRGGLTLAGARTLSWADRRVTTVGKGLELDFTDALGGGDPLAVSLSGRPLTKVGERELGMSKTGKTALIVGGVVLLAAAIYAALLVDEINDNSE